MHGRPRVPQKPENAAASAAKAEKLRVLQSQVIHNHHRRIYTREALDVSSKLIEVNPEVYTAWNYRKLAVGSLLEENTPDPPDVKSLVGGELRIVEIALRRNPKCYAAWYHRKWILGRKLLEVDFEHEFRLLDQLLKADSRNFHGWNYRRFIIALKDTSEEEELKFMTDMINVNFSNYSAWHNRSILLSSMLHEKGEDIFPREKIFSEEFDLVHQALFTDPADQSGWFYHFWLLNQTIALCSRPPDGSSLISSTSGCSKWLAETLEKEIYLFRDLLDFSECKIGKLTLARLLLVHDSVTKQRSHTKEVLELYDDLLKLDPSHIGYYKDQKSMILMDAVLDLESRIPDGLDLCASS